MSFDPKKALDAWKKAKPITLTKTGVSELLRALPAKPTPPQLVEFGKVAIKLEAALANPKIKAEKKAWACIQAIRDELKKYLLEVKERRQEIAGVLKTMHGVFQHYHADVMKGPQTLPLVKSFAPRCGAAFRAWDVATLHGHLDPAIIPEPLAKSFGGAKFGIDEAVRIMETIMADAVSPKPRFDPKKQMPPNLQKFKAEMDRLPPIWSQLAALKV